MKVVDGITGKFIDAEISGFLNKVFELKNTKGPWEVIDLLVTQWSQTNPQKYDSFICTVEDKRNSRANAYGANKSKTLRQVVDFPQPIQDRIRAIYKSDELPFDKEFFKKFWRRYPTFRVAEKL